MEAEQEEEEEEEEYLRARGCENWRWVDVS